MSVSPTATDPQPSTDLGSLRALLPSTGFGTGQSEVWIPNHITALVITAGTTRSDETQRRLAKSRDQLFGAWPYSIEVLKFDAWNRSWTVAIDDLTDGS
jgi:hypothetical protein